MNACLLLLVEVQGIRLRILCRFKGKTGDMEDLWVSEVHNKWTKVIRFAMGVFKGNTMEDLEG